MDGYCDDNNTELTDSNEAFNSMMFKQTTDSPTPLNHATQPTETRSNISIFDALSSTMGTSKNPFSSFSSLSSTTMTSPAPSSLTQLNHVSQSYQFYRNSEDAKTMIKSNRDMIKVLHETMVTTLTKQKENDDLVSQRLIQLAEMTMLSVANINQQQNVFRDNLNIVGDEIKSIKERLHKLESHPSEPMDAIVSSESLPTSLISNLDVVPLNSISVLHKQIENVNVNVAEQKDDDSLEIVRLLQSFLKNGLSCCGFFKGFCPIFSDKEITPESLFIIHVPSLILGLKVSLSIQDNKRYSQWLVSSRWSMDSNSTFRKLFWDKFNLIPERVPGSYISMIRPFLPFIRLSEFSCFLASSFDTLIHQANEHQLALPVFSTIQESMYKLSLVHPVYVNIINASEENSDWFEFSLNQTFHPIRQMISKQTLQQTESLLIKLGHVLRVQSAKLIIVCGSQFRSEKIFRNDKTSVRSVYPCLPQSKLIQSISEIGERSIIVDTEALDVNSLIAFFSPPQSLLPSTLSDSTSTQQKKRKHASIKKTKH